MRIINRFDQILSCYPDRSFDLEAWRRYANAIDGGLGGKCEQDAQDYDFDRDVRPVLNQVLRDWETARVANASFTAVTKRLNDSLPLLFDRDIDLDVVLYLGLCNGAGWATTLGGRDVILLGIEKIVELNWQNEDDMQALIFHEIGHKWHQTYGVLYPETRSAGDESLAQLFREGIAMVCEQILCRDGNHYHQDKNGWLAWCTAHQDEIKREYLRRVDGQLSTQDFFGDWRQYQGHSDVGYYLGCEFIKFMERQDELTDIANFSIGQIAERFRAFASPT